MKITVGVANEGHLKYASTICKMIEEASKIRGTGIAKREPNYIKCKIREGKSVIATYKGEVVGYCYIESWEKQKFVANSGLIVHPDYRKTGLARKIKKVIFELSLLKFPDSKIFGITTSLAVMKLNSDLGYKPVTFNKLTHDDSFWKGCETCVNHDILLRTKRSMCLCTGMIYDPATLPVNNFHVRQQIFWKNFRLFMIERQKRIRSKAKEYPILNKIYHEKQ